jgi:hypothetical protein
VPTCTPEQAWSALYAVYDAGGVVVGVSRVDEEPDTPLQHVAWLLWYAATSEGMRGRWTLASVLENTYRKQARYDGLDLMPWKTVASALRRFVAWEYKAVTIRGKRRKRLAYLMPENLEDVRLRSNVVEFDAARHAG